MEKNLQEIFDDKYIIKWLACSGIENIDDLLEFIQSGRSLRRLRNIGKKTETTILSCLKEKNFLK